jgi:hypothetical protein
MIENMTDGNPDAIKPLYIYVNKKERELSVVDYGPAMDGKELSDRFGQRGQEQKTHHKKSRSIFGQGLSDLLFSRKRGGSVNCFKDDLFYRAEFKNRSKKSDQTQKLVIEQVIEINDGKIKANSEIRQEYFIPEGNGTCVRFKYDESEGHFPQKETLIKGLTNMYMLRYINSDPKRDIQLIYVDPKGKLGKPEKIVYKFREVKEDDILGRLDEKIKYGKTILPIKGWVARWSEPLTQGEVEKDEREGGLLVIDENRNVYDLTLFDYDSYDSAKKLHGEIVIDGLRDIISEKLNDPENPEEILTNTRDGFDRNHPFYKDILCPIIKKWLGPIILEEERRENVVESHLSKEIKERQKKAFSILNKLDKRLNQEIRDLGEEESAGKEHIDEPLTDEPPEPPKPRPKDGIEFSRSSVSLKVNDKYRLKLKVDTLVIPVGSKITIANNEPSILVHPKEITVSSDETSEDNIFSTPIVLQGLEVNKQDVVEASWQDKKAKVLVSILEEEIYKPTKPIEFHPKSYKCSIGSHKNVYLYIDSTRAGSKGKIIFSIDEADITLDKTEVELSENTKCYDGILKIENGFRGHRDGASGTIHAEFNGATDDAKIVIGKDEPNKDESSGNFKDWRYLPMEQLPFQTFYNEVRGFIQINAKFPYLQMYFGKDQESVEEAIKNNIHAQTMLAELILDEALTKIISQAYSENKLDRRYPHDPLTDVRRYIHEEKLKIAKEFHEVFVDFNLKKGTAKETTSTENQLDVSKE